MQGRIDLFPYQGCYLTLDTVKALQAAESQIHNKGGKLLLAERPLAMMSWEEVQNNPGLLGNSPTVSAIPTGREVVLSIEGIRPEWEIPLLWGTLVPLGFIPWDRYPTVSSPTRRVFHKVGPWRFLLDYLPATGQGEESWASFCAAAQVDVGKWEGKGRTERMIQAQLYRIGLGHGPVDGKIGEITRKAIVKAGFGSLNLASLAERLCQAESHPAAITSQRGQINFSGSEIIPQSFGDIKIVRTPSGASFSVEGPGRIVLDFSGAS